MHKMFEFVIGFLPFVAYDRIYDIFKGAAQEIGGDAGGTRGRAEKLAANFAKGYLLLRGFVVK